MEYKKNSIGIEGISDIQNALSELPNKFNRNVWNSIFTKALRSEIKPDLEAGLSEDDRKFVKIQMAKTKDKNSAGMVIGIDEDGYHIRFLEYGTVKRETKKGYNRGVMTPKPFIARLYFSKMESVVRYVERNAAELADKWLSGKLKRMNK